MQSQENIDWYQDIFDVLECQGIDLIAHVPDAGHAPLIRKCDARNDMDVVTLTTEEEGVGLLCGAWAGGAEGRFINAVEWRWQLRQCIGAPRYLSGAISVDYFHAWRVG